MTQEDTSQATTTEEQTAAQETTEAVTTEQWQSFLGNLASQNQALQAQLNQTQNALYADRNQQRQEIINKLPAEEKAAALEAELNAIKQTAAAASAQSISQQVWQQRDAESAARILSIHGLSGYEPELFRAAWDVNWMPRFVASVEQLVKGNRAKGANANAKNNPANRANIGNGSGNQIPDLDPNASGYDTISYALRRAQGR